MTSERLPSVTITWPRPAGRFYPSGPGQIVMTGEDRRPLDVVQGMLHWNADGLVLARAILSGDAPEDSPHEYVVREMRIADAP